MFRLIMVVIGVINMTFSANLAKKFWNLAPSIFSKLSHIPKYKLIKLLNIKYTFRFIPTSMLKLNSQLIEQKKMKFKISPKNHGNERITKRKNKHIKKTSWLNQRQAYKTTTAGLKSSIRKLCLQTKTKIFPNSN